MESEFSFITHSVLCRAIKINRFCFFMIFEFEIIIISVVLSRWIPHVCMRVRTGMCVCVESREAKAYWGESRCIIA